MTSSDSSSSVRVVSSPGSGETSRCDPKVGSSGASFGPPSPVDARVLRDLEVMKSDHDLDTTVTEGSLVVIRERYNIPVEYGLHVSQPRQRLYSLDAPDMCISVDALEAGLRFPLHPLIEECLRWWRISPNQVAPNSWRYLVVFLGECRGAEIIPAQNLFMACFHLCKSRGGYYLTARVGFRVSGAPSNNKGWKSRYLYVSGPVWGFRLNWSAHPIDNASPYLSKEETVLVGKLKGILSSSRAIKEMVELWLVEAGLSPASRGTIILLYFSLSNCSLTCRSGCRSDGSRGATRDAQGGKRKGPSDPPHRPGGRCFSCKGSLEGFVEEVDCHADRAGRGCSEITFMDYRIKQLQEELDALKSNGVPEAVAKAEERASELREELEKTKRERGEELLRREASEKELHEVRSHLGDAQRLLKEARIRARKMDDELLQVVKDLKSARAELPRQSTVQYKESLDFKEGLKRMGRVTYEYGYRVALACFRARHPDAEVEEDPFTIHPKDDLMPMERQQAFDDSVPPEP
ncbi:hypothetical protein B296_00035663 [Ensete ventricosum]|uniref:Transposase (putative) gypsy type domain-containing protein n=1 Tax=Ensete ventricosum TaxID=4639 RepID=A0A426X290_ENSVE|nr:hypothetical protein B296_00035663 [Ensete ventricosum]